MGVIPAHLHTAVAPALASRAAEIGGVLRDRIAVGGLVRRTPAIATLVGQGAACLSRALDLESGGAK